MIEFRNLTKKRINTAEFKELYNKIFPPKHPESSRKFELSVVFAQPHFMRRLNKQYRGKNKTANVLSFALEKGKVGPGEIFLNIKEKKLPYLFLHGMLHLKGYDHVKKSDARKMEKLEQKILNK